MDRGLRNRTLATMAVIGGVAMGVLTPAAGAQKGVLGYGADPATGITDLNGGSRYTALWAGAGTVVAKLDTSDGSVEQSSYRDGQLAVPSVAFDQSPGGLSADGEVLVLTKPGVRFPQTRSDFVVFDTKRLKVLDEVSFDGTFTFDALSPNGRWLYLVEYTSPRDLSEYVVRRYDLERNEMQRAPILDPDESAEEMYGAPITRAVSEDGRWAYTLYDGNEHPFIHALDTQSGSAVCIDLDQLEGDRNLYRFDLQPSLDGSTLGVVDRGEPVANVDLGSFDVSEPAAPAAAAPAQPADDGDGLPWALIAGGGALLVVAGALVAVRRRRPDRVDELELERLVEHERGAGANGAGEEDAREREPVA
jgi:hypothetical protein